MTPTDAIQLPKCPDLPSWRYALSFAITLTTILTMQWAGAGYWSLLVAVYGVWSFWDGFNRSDHISNFYHDLQLKMIDSELDRLLEVAARIQPPSSHPREQDHPTPAPDRSH